MLLIIDNYDSFVYNLYHYFAAIIGEKNVKIIKNDEIDIKFIYENLKPIMILISPGPCAPKDAGLCLDLLKENNGRSSIFGVCLGHQAIVEAFGGEVIPSGDPKHGIASVINHNGKGIYHDLPNPLSVARYHSLIAKKEILPECLEITSWTEDGVIMGVKHRSLPIEGVQFHPESILTQNGKELVKNIVSIYYDKR